MKKPATNREIIKRQRASGLTNQQYADLLGVSRHTLLSWKRNPKDSGFRRAPEVALRLARTLSP